MSLSILKYIQESCSHRVCLLPNGILEIARYRESIEL